MPGTGTAQYHPFCLPGCHGHRGSWRGGGYPIGGKGTGAFRSRYLHADPGTAAGTGQIQGLEVITNGIDLEGKTVLMWDDIVSYGGSMYYGALKLKELGVDKIYAYASHTENSILDKEKGTLIKLLEDGTVERLFTTSSLFTGKHEKITVL